MQPIAYTSLNESQLKQVAYLFADVHFGTDPRTFGYELNKDGDVIGRTIEGKPQTVKLKSGRRASNVNVSVLSEVNITDELCQQAKMNLDALAVSIAQKMYLSQPQEVNHE